MSSKLLPSLLRHVSMVALLLVLSGCHQAPPETGDVDSELSLSSSPSTSDDKETLEYGFEEEDSGAEFEANRKELQNFLQSEYEPLQNWMGEKFEVKYRAMTLELIFDQVPLKDIHYKIEDLEGIESKKSFSFESPIISRRALLKEISDHWGVDMKFDFDESGNPSAVRVFPRP